MPIELCVGDLIKRREKKKVCQCVQVWAWEREEIQNCLEELWCPLVHSRAFPVLQDVLAQQIIPAAPARGWLNVGVSSPGSVCSLPAPCSIPPRRLTLYNHCSPVRLRPLDTRIRTHTYPECNNTKAYSAFCVHSISLCTEQQVSERERKKQKTRRIPANSCRRTRRANFHTELNYCVQWSTFINLPGIIYSL